MSPFPFPLFMRCHMAKKKAKKKTTKKKATKKKAKKRAKRAKSSPMM